MSASVANHGLDHPVALALRSGCAGQRQLFEDAPTYLLGALLADRGPAMTVSVYLLVQVANRLIAR